MGKAERATQEQVAQWTPKLVRDRMVEAVRWARYNVGPTGPSGIRSAMPSYTPSLDDHLTEGWGLPERAEGVELEDKVVRIALPPDRIDALVWALDWCRLYLAKDHPGDAVILNLWLRCRVYRGNFEVALKARGFPASRRHADRMKDRALSIISQKLDEEGHRP